MAETDAQERADTLVSKEAVLALVERLYQNSAFSGHDDGTLAAVAKAIRALPAHAGQGEAEKLRKALEWYEARVSLCNNFLQEGHDARDALARDNGKRARAALNREGDSEG